MMSMIGYFHAVRAIHLLWSDSLSNPVETPTMASRRVTDEEGRVWECKPETAEAPGRDVNLVCTTADLRVPLRLKVSWQWAKMAEKGLARMIAAAAPRMVSG
jgi:hypothetical protein